VGGFAALDLGDKAAAGLGKFAEEVVVPEVLGGVGAGRALACADGDEDADLTTWVLVYSCFVKGVGGWVEFALAFVDEDALSDLDRFEGEPSGGSCASGLPDRAVEFRGGLFTGIVGAEEGRWLVFGGSLVSSCYSTWGG
jgi:hypothetical protein